MKISERRIWQNSDQMKMWERFIGDHFYYFYYYPPIQIGELTQPALIEVVKAVPSSKDRVRMHFIHRIELPIF